MQVVCGFQSTLILTRDGSIYGCGDNGYGRLGVGAPDSSPPATVEHFTALDAACFDGPVVFVALGSLYAAAITASGALYTWGYGAFGNLGHGDRLSLAQPRKVQALADVPMSRVHCAVGQIAVTDPKGRQGLEGPHTFAVSRDGHAFAFGTAHKGILGNLSKKTLAPLADELSPYRIGGDLRDGAAGQQSNYLDGEPVVDARASAIHSAVLTASGRLWTFGCGSGGRMGLEAFEYGLGGKRDRMKCYVFTPTAIEAFVAAGLAVHSFDLSRRTMIAIATAAAAADEAAAIGER